MITTYTNDIPQCALHRKITTGYNEYPKQKSVTPIVIGDINFIRSPINPVNPITTSNIEAAIRLPWS